MGATAANRRPGPPTLRVPSPEFEAIKESGAMVVVTLDGAAVQRCVGYDIAEGWVQDIGLDADGRALRTPDGEDYIIRRLTGEVRAYLVGPQ